MDCLQTSPTRHGSHAWNTRYSCIAQLSDISPFHGFHCWQPVTFEHHDKDNFPLKPKEITWHAMPHSHYYDNELQTAKRGEEDQVNRLHKQVNN